MKNLYLITGGSGHLGFTITMQLLNKSAKIVVFDIQNNPKLQEQKLKNQDSIDLIQGDITNKDDLEKLFEKIHTIRQDMDKKSKVFVIHCASIVSIQSKPSRKIHQVNINGTKNIIDFCIKHKIDRFLYVSSVHAIPEKKKEVIEEVSSFDFSLVTGQYAKTKAIATQAVLDSTKEGLNAVVVHPSGIIGPYDFAKGHTTRLFVDYINGKLTAAIKGGYDFVDVRDVANGALLALEKGRTGECYILSNKYITIEELLNRIAVCAKRSPIRTYLPLWFIKPLAPVAEFYYNIRHVKPLFTPYSISILAKGSTFSHSKATNELGYQTRPLEKTIEDTVKWISQNKS